MRRVTMSCWICWVPSWEQFTAHRKRPVIANVAIARELAMRQNALKCVLSQGISCGSPCRCLRAFFHFAAHANSNVGISSLMATALDARRAAHLCTATESLVKFPLHRLE